MPTPAKNFKIRGQPCWGQTLTTVFVVTNNPTSKLKKFTEGRGGGVKWSACLPSTPTIRVRILLKRTVFTVRFVFEKTKINKKRPGLAHLKKEVHRDRTEHIIIIFSECLNFKWRMWSSGMVCFKSVLRTQSWVPYSLVIIKTFWWGATIAQWIRLCLPFCCPGFDSQAHQLCFYHYSQICAIFVHAMWEKNKNK